MKKKPALMFTAMLLVCVIAVAATLAYLTSTPDPVTNTFTVGNVDITLDESPVDPYGSEIPGATPTTENDYMLIPGNTYVKDPTIHVAQGSEPCYLFVKVVNGLEGLEATIPPTLEPDTTPDPSEEPWVDPSIAAQMAEYGWLPLAGYPDIYYFTGVEDTSDSTNPNNEYAFVEGGYVVDARNAAMDVVVFETVTIRNDVSFTPVPTNTPAPTDTTITTEDPTPLDTTITTDTPSPTDTPEPITFEIVVTSCAIQAMGFDSAIEAYQQAQPEGFYVAPTTAPEQTNP